ncbi:hypothetical protein C8J57DRAFT_1222825 [Mycena rebaudengoi]|nr:hypothetical protein C8J57DRAFT_1222825 [Mycena rebaudengoi]
MYAFQIMNSQDPGVETQELPRGSGGCHNHGESELDGANRVLKQRAGRGGRSEFMRLENAEARDPPPQLRRVPDPTPPPPAPRPRCAPRQVADPPRLAHPAEPAHIPPRRLRGPRRTCTWSLVWTEANGVKAVRGLERKVVSVEVSGGCGVEGVLLPLGAGCIGHGHGGMGERKRGGWKEADAGVGILRLRIEVQLGTWMASTRAASSAHSTSGHGHYTNTQVNIGYIAGRKGGRRTQKTARAAQEHKPDVAPIRRRIPRGRRALHPPAPTRALRTPVRLGGSAGRHG